MKNMFNFIIFLFFAFGPLCFAASTEPTYSFVRPAGICPSGVQFSPAVSVSGTASAACSSWLSYDSAYLSTCPNPAYSFSNYHITSIVGSVCNASRTAYGSTVNSSTTLSFTCPSSYTFNSSSGLCESSLDTCSSLGVDVNAFVAKCSQMLDGSPTQCLNSDNTPFLLQGCPQLDCPDGSKTTYPTPCPVASCPEGFTLSDVAGVGKTCIKALPDDEFQNPCVNVSGSDVPICAEDGKNCQMVNGVFICLKEEPEVIDGSTCYLINSKNYCLSNQPTIETQKTTTTNPDGSTTVKEVQKPSINGVPARVKETTTHPDGSVTVISNNPGDLTDLGLQPQPTQKIDLSNVEKNTKDTADNTKSLLDEIIGFFDLPADFEVIDESPIEFPGLQTALDADLTGYQGFVNEQNPMKAYYDANPFSAAISSMLPSDTSCGYVLETTIFGKSFRMAPCEKLQPLREILAWFFSILTAWQVINITAKSIVRF